MNPQGMRGIAYAGGHYTGYEATQKQRQLECAMRVQENRILVNEATGDAARLQTAQIRLHMLDGEYNRFSRAAGLRRMDERIGVARFGKYQKSQSDHSRNAKAQFYSPATRSGEYV